MSQELLHPAFTVSADQLKRAFEDFEERGKRGTRVSIGEQQSAGVPVMGPLGNRETLNLSIMFLSPISQARRMGYEFGKNARSRTPADRAAILARLSPRGNAVYFECTLDPPRDSNIEAPPISFALLSKSGTKMEPTEAPRFVFPDRDFTPTNLPLTFNAGSTAAPRITHTMNKLTLVVGGENGEERLEFALSNP